MVYCNFFRQDISSIDVIFPGHRKQLDSKNVNEVKSLHWLKLVNKSTVINIVGSVAERIKAPYLRRPCDHDCVI